MVYNKIMKINIEIEYLSDKKDIVNFHIIENDVHYGKEAINFFKLISESLFKSGVKMILCSIKNIKSTRHIRLFVIQCGMELALRLSDKNEIIYFLKRSELHG